ncbi:MAG: GAF domain-containing protein [Chloroflexi bacterium]|nr:MAG: GAF domain-containing protein [Chloroflexota bacterium]
MAQQTQKFNPLKAVFRKINPAASLQNQLLIAFSVTVLLAIVVSSSIVTWLETRAARENVFEQLESIAILTESEINTWVENLETDLAVLVAQDTALRRMRQALDKQAFLFVTTRELRGNFDTMIDLTDRFSEIFLLDTDGQVVVSTNPVQEGKIFKQETFFHEGLIAPFVQTPRYSPALDQVSVIVARPVHRIDGKVIGVLAGRANLDQLNEITVDRSRFGKTGESYLVGLNHGLITQSRHPGYLPRQTFVRSDGVNIALNQQQNGSGLYNDFRGEPVAGVYRWLPSLKVALLTEQDQSEAFESVRVFLVTNLAIAAIAVLVAMAAAVYVTRRISRPIKELADTATQIAAGDLSLQAQTHRADEIGDLTHSFNRMTERLRESIETLEDRVQERTRALEIEADVSRQAIATLDINELLQSVVSRIQDEYNFYHTHIYLIDHATDALIIAAAAGKTGQILTARNHRLQMGQGIAGMVAQSNQVFFSNNVRQESNFQINPLLPQTQSELAVPLRRGQDVVGVLDIHATRKNRFTPEDIGLMQSIANLTAIALDNARLLDETKEALKKVEHLNRQLTRERWEEFTDTLTTSGYRYKTGHTNPLPQQSDVWLSPMKQAAKSKQLVKQSGKTNGDNPKSELAVPLVLRDQVIGVLGVRREEVPLWAEEEVAAIEVVAGQVARALENARLSKEQEKTIVQLKELDRLKSEFLTSMSHELRTPLNSIIGFADVLLQGIDGELPELALNDIQLIYNSGQHLLALINDVLDLSKIEAERMELVLEEVNVAQVTQEVLSASGSLFKNKPVKIVQEIDQNLPLVQADKLRFNQIMLNLVSNAAKFTKEGTITIRAGISEHNPEFVRISVKDTGIGIMPDKQQTIFDRFRQADSSTTRQYGGTGLGLAICKKLVEMHGGEIGVNSQIGQGSEFYFTIPLAGASVAAETQKSGPATN